MSDIVNQEKFNITAVNTEPVLRQAEKEKKTEQAPAPTLAENDEAEASQKKAEPTAAQQQQDTYAGAGVKTAGDGGIDKGGGEAYITNKAGSKITDADTVIAIAEIAANHNTQDIKADKMAEELKAKGIDCYETTVDGKPAIKFANGDVFIDSSGNHALGLEDGDFEKALAQIEQKFGVNLDALESRVQSINLEDKLKHEQKDLAGVLGLQEAMNMLAGGQAAKDGAENPQAAAKDLTELFEELDGELQEKGHQGPAAAELYEEDTLEETLAKYGIQMPEIPRQNQQAQTLDDISSKIFGGALLISRLKA